MRQSNASAGLIGQVVAGTHVVLMGWDITDPALKTDLLGFAIRRTDVTSGEVFWLRGMKTFPSTVPQLAPGGTASSQDQPFQTFQWADYAASPGRRYLYDVVGMHGTPGALTAGASLSFDITTEAEIDGVHAVSFNRGAIASQEYARRFQDKPPNVVGAPAYAWLSRGLLEAIQTFIAQASDASYGLRVAIYEFQWPAVLDALKAAVTRQVDVKVLYDAIENAAEDPVRKNEEAIETAAISAVCQGVTHGKIMHNKFIVLLKDGSPVSVLTGSTNYTENGIFGHLNCAHVVNDPAVAAVYLESWNELSGDPALAELRQWNDERTPTPAVPPPSGIVEVFSPQRGHGTLDRYGELAGTAARALFMTFAFGMNKVFAPTYGRNDGVLRFALMDSVGVGRGKAEAEQQIESLRQVPGTVIAIGGNIELNSFDRWLKERDGLAPDEHVRWVHTKFMLVDPLSDDPIVVTGSANFSEASVTTNHENMLLIRGDRRVADIYLGEFMREFSSYAFRDAAARADAPADFRPQDLAADPSWLARYDEPGTSQALRRAYFAGR